jgi:hypothetical protein
MNAEREFVRLCEAERAQITAAWTEAVFATYPLDTSGFARTLEDRFRNPAGHVTREALEKIYTAVGGGASSERELREALEMFVKLRAAQGFAPIQALGVLYLLKPLLRERILPVCADSGLLKEFLEAESRLDSVMLIACELYTASREQLYEERIGEMRRQHSQLLRWTRKKGVGPEAGDGA